MEHAETLAKQNLEGQIWERIDATKEINSTAKSLVASLSAQSLLQTIADARNLQTFGKEEEGHEGTWLLTPAIQATQVIKGMN